MKFVQVVEFTSDATPDELVAAEREWRQQTMGRRTNLLEWFLVDRADPRHKFAVNGFAHAGAAAANSNLPETNALAEQIGAMADGEVRFVDCDFVDQAEAERDALAEGLAAAFATGKVGAGVFTDDVFFDMNVPSWRYQLEGLETARSMFASDVVPGDVLAMHVTPTFDGFVLELSVRDPEHMYRQLLLARTRGGLISEVTLYCTGPWDAATEERQKREAPMISGRDA